MEEVKRSSVRAQQQASGQTQHWMPSGKVRRGLDPRCDGEQSKVRSEAGVAEAVFSRKAAKEIASGISFRGKDLAPGARCLELMKVCDFYEAKASGAYVDSQLCGRYLHGMAREVRALSMALREAEKARKRRIRDLENVCAEWDEHFGGLPGQDGDMKIVPWTPAAVKKTLDMAKLKMEKLESEVREARAEAAETKREAEVTLEEHGRASREHAARQRCMHEKLRENDRIDSEAREAKRAAEAASLYLAENAASSSARLEETRLLETGLREAQAQFLDLKAENKNLRTDLDAERLRAKDATAALQRGAVEVKRYRELRRLAVDEALSADKALRRAKLVDSGTQCPSHVGVVRFSASPRGRLARGAGANVSASGVPSSLSVADLCDSITNLLGITVLAAEPRRALDVDGARTFDLTVPTAQDARKLIELPGGCLPDILQEDSEEKPPNFDDIFPAFKTPPAKTTSYFRRGRQGLPVPVTCS